MKKDFIKKFGAVVLALIVFVGCLGVDSDVAYAYTDADIVSVDDYDFVYDVDKLYSYTYFSESTQLFSVNNVIKSYTVSVEYFSDSPIYCLSVRDYYFSNNYNRDCIYYSDVVFSESPLSFGETYCNGSGSLNSTRLDSVTMSDGKVYYLASVYSSQMCAYDGTLNTDGVDYMVDIDIDYLPVDESSIFEIFLANYDFPPKAFTYNPDLGYLQNITQKLIAVNTASGGVDLPSARLKFTFDSLSTSGVDLSSGEYSVRLYQQVCYYKDNLSEVFKEDYPLVEIGKFPISDNSVSFTVADAMAKVNNETSGILSSWDLFWNGCERSDSIYLQIIKKGSDGSEEYGGLVKLMHPASGGVFASTYTPDLSPDDGGYVGDNVESGMGTGTNFEDAELNADDDVVNGSNSSDSLIGMVNGYLSTLGAIPAMIGNMLSFLPQWCVDLISVSFGLLCILIGFKFLRG